MAPQYVAGKQYARPPVGGSTDIFDYHPAAAGAVHTDDAAGGVLYHHADVLDTAFAAEKQQIARHHIAQRHFGALQRLCGGAAGNRHVKFFQDKTGKARAIEARGRAYAGIAIADADILLGQADHFFPQLNHLRAKGTDRAVSGTGK